MNKYIKGLASSIKLLTRLNIIKTLYLNFKMLPLKDAIKLPIFIYGKIIFHGLSGSISIKAPIRRGMIHIGYKWIDLSPSSFLPNQLTLSGRLIFEGECIISGGVALAIQNKNAECFIGNNVVIGGGCVVKSLDKLEILKFTRIASNCIVMNSNMHYVKNIETGVIHKSWGEISLGEYCWINSGTTITKGTKVPDYSIVARGSFLNKNYSINGNNAFIVGAPAKIASNYSQRIFDRSKEIELNNFFRANTDSEYFQDEKGHFIESEPESFNN